MSSNRVFQPCIIKSIKVANNNHIAKADVISYDCKPGSTVTKYIHIWNCPGHKLTKVLCMVDIVILKKKIDIL